MTDKARAGEGNTLQPRRVKWDGYNVTGNQLLIVALVLIVAVFILLFRALSLRAPGRAKLSFGDIFKVEIDLGVADRERAKKAIGSAIQERGGNVDTAGQEIDRASTTRVGRVLWVDDHPDYNLHETIALEELGLFVTKATATHAAEVYLQSLRFDLVITDLGRGDDPDAGLELLKKVQLTQESIPVIVYTLAASEKRTALVQAGARAVVDTPSELIAAVLTNRQAYG
jgi:CheY-like chemotaxis protein